MLNVTNCYIVFIGKCNIVIVVIFKFLVFYLQQCTKYIQKVHGKKVIPTNIKNNTLVPTLA